MKKNLTKTFVALTFLLSANVQAADINSATEVPKMLIYIQPTAYTHSIYLLHPFYEYWFVPGPIVEAKAMAKLTQTYEDVSLCEGNQFGRTLVWLKPEMFYNPLLHLFYGKVTAHVYSGMGKFVSSHEGEATVRGFLNIQPDHWIEQAFSLAVDDMAAKMQADTALQALLNNVEPISANDATPCSMVTLLPRPKNRFMFF